MKVKFYVYSDPYKFKLDKRQYSNPCRIKRLVYELLKLFFFKFLRRQLTAIDEL